MALHPPNVLFLFTDDQRFDTIAALGNEEIRTPNMDRLVQKGVSFTRAYIPGGTSGAVCMPSRAMLHTGRSLFRIEEAGKRIPKEHKTLGEAFRERGTITFGTGKWHNGADSYHRSFDQGDEIFLGGMADHWNMPAYRFDPTGKYDARCPQVKDPHMSNEVTWRACDHIHAGCHSTELISETAIRFLRDCDKQVPFFCYVSFLAPHDPRTMPRSFLDLYPPEKIVLPPNFLEMHPFDNGELRIRDEKLAGFPRSTSEVQRHLAEYYAMISHLDCHIGRILDVLEEEGLSDNTLIVLAGDNGLAVGQHGLMGKQNCYDHSVRVPLLLSGPGLPKDVKSEACIYLYDLFPTLCSLVGMPVPDTVEGQDMSEMVFDPKRAGRDVLTFAYLDKHRAIQRDGFKLIEYVVKEEHTQTQLFDLKADPWETHNLFGNEDFMPKVRSLREEMIRLSWENGDRDTEWGKVFWSAFQE